MKIMFITVRADFGGGTKHVDLLIENLGDDCELYIACPNDKPFFDKWKNSKKVVDVMYIPHRNFSIKRLLILLKYIKSNNICILHSHGKGAGIYSRLSKLFYPKVKIIHTLHGLHIKEYGHFKRFLYINFEKILTIFTDLFINVSYGEKELCLTSNIFSEDRSVVIYNGVENIQYNSLARLKFNLENKIVITTISRFDYAKNMSMALDIAKMFVNNKDVIFLWVGDGPDRKDLLDVISREKISNILSVGFSSEIADYLSVTNIYLSTSRWEGLPLSLLEANSLSVPVVASNVIGNNEVVAHGISGYLYNDLEEAQKYILKLIYDKKQYSDFSVNAKKLFEDKFMIKNMVRYTSEIYKKIGSDCK